MSEFIITSTSLQLVSPINSFVDRVFEIEGKTYFSASSHPAIGIEVSNFEEIKDVLIQGATLNIAPNGTDSSYTVNISPTPEKKKKEKTSTNSSSPTRDIHKLLARF